MGLSNRCDRVNVFSFDLGTFPFGERVPVCRVFTLRPVRLGPETEVSQGEEGTRRGSFRSRCPQ